MSLKMIGTIGIPAAADSAFDHGAFDPKTRRVFVAHTARDSVEVIDHDAGRHIATLPGFPEAAGVVAEDGFVLVTNRGAASLAWLDAQSLKTQTVFKTGLRPNGVALVARQGLAIVASIGDENHGPRLEVLSRHGNHYVVDLPGRPRWCVTDAAAERVFLAIRDPSMVFVARLPALRHVEYWRLPSGGAHGLDIDHRRGRLYVACDDGALVEVDIGAGTASDQWPIAGVPDATSFNPASGLVHVAIGEPGLVQTIDPRTGAITKTMTAAGAHTTAFAAPDILYVFSPAHGWSACPCGRAFGCSSTQRSGATLRFLSETRTNTIGTVRVAMPLRSLSDRGSGRSRSATGFYAFSGPDLAWQAGKNLGRLTRFERPFSYP